MFNKRAPSSVHRKLITAGQVFGAGKSELGRNALQRASVDDVKVPLLRRFSPELVNDYLTAHTITIDLKRVKQPQYEVKNLQVFLRGIPSQALQDAAAAAGHTFAHAPNSSLLELCALYTRQLGHAVFLHWDEV